jgi:branched-chain amino acid transport system substrate-binding protein
LTRDDNGTPGDAVRVAEELVSREKVAMLLGTFASNVGLAVADFAKQRKVPFLASEPLTDKIVWDNGNKYTYRLRASTFMQTAMLVPEAAKLGKKRWAIVYPNYEYGQSATAGVQEADDLPAARRASSSSRSRCRSARSIRVRSCRR